MLIKHMIFDFDGTIADSSDLPLVIANKLADKFNYKPLTQTDIQGYRDMSVQQRFKKIGVPFYKIPRYTIACVAEYRKLLHAIRIYEGIRETIEGIKKLGISVSIISSNSVENIQAFLVKNNLTMFDDVISAKNIFGKHKTIQKYLKKKKITNGEILYVGDELRDIIACQKIAVPIISVTWGYDALSLLQSKHPTYIVHQPKEILTLVQRLCI